MQQFVSPFNATQQAANIAAAITVVPVPTTFNNTLDASIYWTGSRIEYVTNPYDIIDFELTDSVNDYYVNYSEGNDTNAGTSTGAGNSWKTLDYAVANATTPAVIHVEDDWTGYLSSGAGTKTFTGKLKIKGEGASGRTIIAAMRENYTKASFSWVATGGADAYKSSASGPAANYRSMFDRNIRNMQGIPKPMTAAADAATCESTPGTFYWDSGASTIYVHMFDGREPDPADGWLYAASPFDFEVHQGGASSSDVILLENLEFLSNNGNTPGGAGMRYRPVTTGAENSARVGCRNVLVYGGFDNGFEIYDADVVVMDNCHAWYNTVDGFNYHSFVSTGTKGEFITVYEHDCTAFNNGWEGWADQQALSTSANCTTSHDSMHIIRTNGRYGKCNGAVVADVNGVHSLNYNVEASYPDQGGTASPKALFWHDAYLGAGTTKIMYLWGCIGDDAADADVNIVSTEAQGGGATGEVRVEWWRGQADGRVDGVIYDFDGDVA